VVDFQRETGTFNGHESTTDAPERATFKRELEPAARWDRRQNWPPRPHPKAHRCSAELVELPVEIGINPLGFSEPDIHVFNSVEGDRSGTVGDAQPVQIERSGTGNEIVGHRNMCLLADRERASPMRCVSPPDEFVVMATAGSRRPTGE